MSKRSFNYLKIQINNGTPDQPAKRQKCCSPDEGCFSGSTEESGRKSSVTFDKDIDSILCLQDKGDDGYFSLSFEAQDAIKDIPEDLTLGPPLFESSICGNEESLNSTGWETTLPLQVQVKSVVVPVVPPGGTTRPHLEREEEEKKKYINAVTRHMQERPNTQDVMGELFSLMSTVAQNSNDPQWQHPSDLTRKNYEKKFNPTPVTLQEWESKMDMNHKRFANVPKIFKRCM